MITDPLCYRIFRTIPETLFLSLGMPLAAAQAMAARYQFEAIEFKETSFRTDAVFVPKESDLPIYFVEMQFYALPSVYADILAKTYTYLKQHDPAQDYCAVVMFANRALEPTGLKPYQPLLDSGNLRRYYLDEMHFAPDAPFGLAILGLFSQADEQATSTARTLIVRAKNEIQDSALRADLIELIETAMLYKLAGLTREEIQAMLQVQDLRDTRAFKDYRDEVLTEERQRTMQEKLRTIAKLAARGMPAAEIADIVELDVASVTDAMPKSV